MGTDQVPEVLGDHELECLGRARRITRDHRVARHDLAHGRRVWVKTLRGDLQCPSACASAPRNRPPTHPVSEVLRSEDPAEALLVVNDEDAVRALRGAQLARLRDADVLWDSECRARLQRGDGAFRRGASRALSWAPALRRRNRALARELGLDLLTYSLCTRGSVSAVST